VHWLLLMELLMNAQGAEVVGVGALGQWQGRSSA
jgi:hypothetical protein